MPSSPFGRICLLFATLALCLAAAARAGDATAAGAATAGAPSSTWIAWEAPFTGDDDRDGWTVVELGLAAGGPFDLGTQKLPGPPEWRSHTYGGLTPDTDYYLQVTFVDPDGVTGANPQIVGPIRTLAAASNAVTLGSPTVEARETEIHVSLPISDDANTNSYGTVEIATDPGGPWTERCGDPSNPRLPFHPKLCRLRSLTPGTDYWVRIDIADPDGISGTDPQVIGPINYAGRANVAAGMPITADPGWGCCPNPAQLVDGRIQYRYWTYGFAWTGGTSGYGGGAAGWKKATIDLGAPTTFDRVEVWLHDNNSPPIDWRVETSPDGASWTEAWSTTEPQCRGVGEQLQGTSWGYPACSQGAIFPPVTDRYVRYWFDDRTLFSGLHGWAVELEVFGPLPTPTDPTAIASTTHTPAAWSTAPEITVQWSGAADTSGSGLAGYSVLFDTSPSTLPDDTVDVAHTADPHSATSAPLADGQAHWFHLRTCDNDANCSATVHLGPFWIDATDPLDPGDLASGSHALGAPTSLEAVSMTWTAGSDATSGVDGYAWTFSASPAPTCDETKDLEETALGVTGPPLADGSWWFHICTLDHAGNWTSTASAGPYVVDTLPPTDPTALASTGHTPGVWSANAQVAMEWSGAADAGGLAGYSVAFDHRPAHTTPHEYQIQWGANGTGAGRFAEPVGLGVDDQGRLYAVDHQNHRIQVFDASGAFERMWGWGVDTGAAQLEVCTPASLPCLPGLSGNGAGQLNRPVDLEVAASGHVYVSDTHNHRIQKFGLDGALVATWGALGGGAGQLDQPHGLALDAAGNVYVAEHLAHRLQVFDSGGAFLRMWGWGVDTGAAQLEVCTPASLPCQPGIQGAGGGQLAHPNGLAVAAGGEVFVAETTNPRIQVFDAFGAFLRAWGWGVDTGAAQHEVCTPASLPCQAGLAGDGDGQFDGVSYLALDSSERLFASDGANHRIQKFDLAGAYLCQWGAAGSGDGQLNGPLGLAPGPENSLYVADWGNHRVQRFADPTVPDAVIEVAHTADPHGWLSPALADGPDHWFHLRTCDLAGHCTATVHAGPYAIDTAGPADPTTVQSTSHVAGAWSTVDQITVQWSGASDTGGAGVAGYSVLFDAVAATLPDTTIDLAQAGDPHQLTSAPLADGQSHWFHLRTCDGAGGCTTTVHLGPFWIDATPPEVSQVTTVADTGDGVLDEAEVSGVPVTQILVGFDEPVTGADVVANYLLLGDGGDGFQTADCAAGAHPGDEVVAIDTATYAAGSLTATLGVNGGVPLLDGDYRLHVCASPSVRDVPGNPLDGDGNGTGGDDFRRGFTLLDTRPTAHPGPDRTIDVDDAILLGDIPAATGGTGPYTYLWTVTPDACVDLSSAGDANPTLSCDLPEVLTAQLVVTDASSLESPAKAAEITVICPPRRDLFNADYYDTLLLEAVQVITAEKVVVRFGADATFRAGESIALLDGFLVEAGGAFRALIDPATDCF